MHAHPPFKERAAQGCMQNENITFRSTLLKAQILGAFTTPSLVAACYPLAVGGESGCE